MPNLVGQGLAVQTFGQREIRRKWAFRVPPFKVIQGHRNRHVPISYLWLPISDP